MALTGFPDTIQVTLGSAWGSPSHKDPPGLAEGDQVVLRKFSGSNEWSEGGNDNPHGVANRLKFVPFDNQSTSEIGVWLYGGATTSGWSDLGGTTVLSSLTSYEFLEVWNWTGTTGPDWNAGLNNGFFTTATQLYNDGIFSAIEQYVPSYGGPGYTPGSTCVDCIGGDDSFGEDEDSGAEQTLRRCRSVERTDAVQNFLGRMEGCTVEVVGADKHAVEVSTWTYGTSSQVCGSSSTTSRAVIEGADVASDFPRGAYIKHETAGTWHRIVASAYDAPDTDIDVVPPAASAFDGEPVRAVSLAQIVASTLVANGTGTSVYASESTPAEVCQCRLSVNVDGNIENVIAAPDNVIGPVSV